MRNLYNTGRAVLLGSLLVLGLVVGVSAPAWADVNVTACGDFSGSTETKFIIQNNITTTASTGSCLTFPKNAVVYMNGFAVVGLNIDAATRGIVLHDDSFLWGPGIVRGFGICVSAEFIPDPVHPTDTTRANHVAVENIVTNWCGTGIIAGDSYKIKEVRVHDCLPSSLAGTGIDLGQGGFIESSIVRNCDFGVVTGENNKIWNLVVTLHEFTGLQVLTGNAVSRTVISQPRSSGTIGLQYFCFAGGGCQDGSNSVDGHALGNNIQGPGFGVPVVTQSQDIPTLSATNCSGALIPRIPVPGIMATDC